MPMSPRQREMISLAGTVRIPSPPPAVGDVSVIVEPGPELLLRVTHKVSSRLYLERIVRLEDVRAIRAAWPPEEKQAPETGASLIGFKTGAELRKLVADYAAEKPDGPPLITNAVVFVDELAPVVLGVEAAMTAAESVEYYPPIVGDGSSRAARYLARYSAADCRDDERDCHIPPE